MKYSKIISCCLAALLAVFGCTSPDPADEPEKASAISTEQTSIEIPADGGSSQVVLQASHAWTSQADSWITVTPASGDGTVTYNYLTVKADKNSGGQARTGKITFTLTGKNMTAAVTVTQKAAETTMTIADFKKQTTPSDVTKGDWYTLKGQITSIEGYKYGNFYLKDDTGEILVYGLTQTKVSSNDTSFRKIGLNEGDIVTLKTHKSEYRGVAQAGGSKEPAYYVSHTKGDAPAAPYKDFASASIAAGWMELPATSDSDEYKFLYHGMRIGSVAQRGYSLYYDTKNYDAIWAAYPLNKTLIGYGQRTNVWGMDPLLKDSEQAVLTYAYKGGYSRGHQIPSADRSGYEINVKTFYGTNMTPQKSAFNEGFWATLENQVRTWANNTETDTLYVVTGCVLDGSTEYATDNDGKKITVPVAYYKALLRLSAGTYTACAFYYDHSESLGGKYNDATYMMSIDALEKKTGVDYFVNLPAKVGKDKADTIEAADPTNDSFWKQ